MTKTEKRAHPLVIYKTKDIARIFAVTPRSVRRWIADGLLTPFGYRRIGGSALELVFTGAEVEDFMERYFIRAEDLDLTNPPRGKEARAAQVARLIGMSRVLAGKAAAAKTAKLLRYGKV